MKKICCLNRISHFGLDRLKDRYEITEDVNKADGILVRSADMHDLELPQSLRAVARAGAGVNNIPLDECAKRGIVVFNTPGANKNGVKELVIAGLLLASRDIIGGVEWCRENSSDPDIAKLVEKKKSTFAGCEIKGRRLGVIGLGAVGCEVANAASGLGMQVYGYDPYISVNSAWRLSRAVRHIEDMDTIFRECDYISVHVPLTDGTEHMINKEALNTMKDGVVILNFARDRLVDDADMKEALESGKVYRYVTDFPNEMTAGLKGVIAIPHLGASTEEAEDNCAVMAADELRDYLENGNISNSVNYPDCNMGVCQDAGRIAILHANIPNMIGQFSAILAGAKMNIENMINKSRGAYAYTLIDLGNSITDEAVAKLRAIPETYMVRVIGG